MAEEVEMTPVEAAEPPKANPLARPVAPAAAKPAAEGSSNAAPLKPGLRLPPQNGLKPGVKLPPKPGATVSALRPGLKLPPKPGATVSAMRPGLKLPTQNALKPGVKLPPKPVIRKPGATATAAPLPKPVAPVAEKPVAPVAEKPVAPVAEKPIPSAPAAEKHLAVDAQGVGQLPAVEAKAVARDDVAVVVSENPKPLEALKSVTQKLKGITQEIPQQAILRKTGIIAEGAMSEAQKEAAKHKTARISLSDAMGVAPVKNENAPMKTIRIKRPVGIPSATAPLKPQSAASAAPAVADKPAENAAAVAPDAGVTQRKTLKIARPGSGAVRPAGKFGIRRPSQATTVARKSPDEAGTGSAESATPVADVTELPTLTTVSVPVEKTVSDGPVWLWAVSTLVQAAACVAIGALAWFLYLNTQVSYF